MNKLSNFFRLLPLAPLALGLAGCVVSDEDYDAAARLQSDYRAQLQEIYQTNDDLNQRITEAYAEREKLSARLAAAKAESRTEEANPQPGQARATN